MLTAVDSPTSALSDPILKRSENIFPNLELRFDKSAGILWKFLAPNSTPYFSHEQLSDIRAVQAAISDGTRLDLPGYEADNVKFVVFGSKIREIFSLGGDLQLFRDLIAKRDRTGLQFYAKKATDAIFCHAANSRNILTFSLVQGSAMGGGI
jgi:DSF synthase